MSTALWSSVGKKVIMALTGLGLFVFVVAHLLGNLLLLSGNPDAFNRYSHKLVSLRGILIAAETVLLAAFMFHIIAAIAVAISKKKARPESYYKTAGAGGASRKTLSSSTMIYTGVLLLVFTVIHLITFKYGPGMKEGYVTIVDGVAMRDLYRLVVDVFSNRWYVIGYIGVMIFLGLHLRHGFWSAFQSLGAHHPRYTPILYAAGLVFAIVIAVGYLIIPVWIYFRGLAR